MLERVERMAWLIDFYGPLLTERQRRIMELHYESDWSLAEIAEEYGVTRQAIYDILRRAGKALERYEERLQLIDKFLGDRRRISEACALVKELRANYNETKAARVLAILEEILGNEQS